MAMMELKKVAEAEEEDLYTSARFTPGEFRNVIEDCARDGDLNTMLNYVCGELEADGLEEGAEIFRNFLERQLEVMYDLVLG